MPPPEEVDRLVSRTLEILRVRGYSERTGATYGRWIRRFLTANRDSPVHGLSRADVERFLTKLTVVERLAPKTRNQAVSALSFFFGETLDRDDLRGIPRAKEPRRVPVVLSDRQVRAVLRQLYGKYRLLAGLMYGAGLRLTEAHRLRMKDVDFDHRKLTVRDGKGGKDRWAMLPETIVAPLRAQMEIVELQHEDDLHHGAGWARLPHALARKDPRAGFEVGWQFVFPATRWTKDPATNRMGRGHLSPSATQRKVKQAGKAAGILKPISCHTLRRSFATQMLRSGYDVRTVQRLMGHRDVRTTMIYVEAVTEAGIGMRSPLDRDEEPGPNPGEGPPWNNA